jgi:adenylate cyclase
VQQEKYEVRQNRLQLDGLENWLVTRGLRGLPLADHLEGFCQRIHEAGFPMKRVQMGLGTLHPRYGAHTFVWNGRDGTIEHTPRERSDVSELYQRSPIFYMRRTHNLTLRRRLDHSDPLDFPILEELRDGGMTDYAARLIEFDPESARAANLPLPDDQPSGMTGVFFSCATDVRGGFDDSQLQQVERLLPYLSLALKSRLTYDVANTVLETYLGEDAGHRVLTGEIDRGSMDSIKAVIWLCDLRDFTKFADTAGRQDLLEMLNDYLELMARPVHEIGGQILKFLGDGFLAVFRLEEGDDQSVCLRALQAAEALQGELPKFNAIRVSHGKPTMKLGLALHLGDVLYGNIGAKERLDFTVVGPAVNEASRIEALCKSLGREILISNEFHDAAGSSHHQMISLGTHELRGVEQPQEIYTLAI